ISGWLLSGGMSPADAYRSVVLGYAVIGIVLAVGAWRLSPSVEAPPARVRQDGIKSRLGLHRSQAVVLKLSLLFSLDAFGGGFIPQSLMAYWFHLQFGV